MTAPKYAGTTQGDRESPLFRAASASERAGYIEDLVRELGRLAFGPELKALRGALSEAQAEARRAALGAVRR